ncbi:PAS domain S-box protein [Rosistilla oblonga]|uniref:PAS domain S-box protein n=1 Tax=Rosistilla oblonga TaxID=2527990 RepID=UPI003A971102
MQEPPSSNRGETASPSAIVGIGCAAGGIKALELLLHELPRGLGAAFIVVQHLNTDESDVVVDLISPMSPLTVIPLGESPLQLRPDQIYVVPQRSIVHRTEEGFAAVAKQKPDERSNAIDGLFQCLAESSTIPTVGVLLSGAGSDGTLGLASLRDSGGLTIVQDHASATHPEMPQNAAPIADLVLTPDQLGRELAKQIRHIELAKTRRDLESQASRIEANLPQVCDALLAATEYDFRYYKRPTLIRRVARRMQVLRILNADEYLQHLQAQREEAHALFRELLVSVTAFFRDQDTFATLSQRVIPQLFDRYQTGEAIRIWVPGCATGQEAYTIAMLMIEERDQRGSDIEIQIFATDIDQRALNIAREASYPLSISNELTQQRLDRFFRKVGKQYQASKELRDLCVFSVHNLISDPPLSQIDLISCRNLLIYLGQPLQLKLIPVFHFALRPHGFLLLGPSENLTSHQEIFRPIDKQHRISQRKPGPSRTSELLPRRDRATSTIHQTATESSNELDIHHISQRILLDEFAPRYAIVNEDGQLVSTSAGLEQYFEFPNGPFANNVVKIAKSGLRSGLRASLREARESMQTVLRDGLTLKTDEGVQQIHLTVQPMPKIGEQASLFMLVFQERGIVASRKSAEDTVPFAEAAIEQLERELDQTRTELESTVQDLEASNEELKSSNEELRSLNEELRSANEELETSKEEIQAGIEALSRARSDLQNLLDGTQIATIFLDSSGNINSFTPTIRDIYNVRDADVGRPLAEITHKSDKMPAIPRVEKLSHDIAYVEDEFQTTESRWFLRRVLPYRYADRADGVILTFVDISDRKRDEMRLAAMHSVTQLLVDTESFDDAVPQLLESLRQILTVDVCLLWLVDSKSQELYCFESSASDVAASLQTFAERSGDWRFKSGDGLPGLVWKSKRPHWIEDVTATGFTEEVKFVRRDLARDAGIISAIAAPISTGKQFRGAIEFFATSKLEREDSVLRMLGEVGREIGEAIRRKRLNDRYRDQEARKAAVLDAALDCVITMDVEGRIVDFNAAAEATFGVSKAEIEGKSLADTLIPAPMREAHRRGMQRYLKSGEVAVIGKRVELEALRSDGTQFPIELAVNASYNRDGSPFFTAYLRDITDRKAAEAVLQQRAKLAALHGSLAVALAGEAPLNQILQTCCQQLVDELEMAFARVWLLNEKTQTLELAASAGLYTHLDGQHSRVPVGQWKIGKIAASRQPLQTNTILDDANVSDPDWAAREGMVAFAGYPLVVEDRVVGVVGLFARHALAAEVFQQMLPIADAIAQCIARKESEHELMDRERKLRLALDAGRLGSWHWDILSDRVAWSTQLYELFGYEIGQFQPTRAGFLDIIHADDRQAVSQRIDNLFTGTCESFDMEFRIIRGDDGHVIWSSGRGVVRRDHEMQPLSILAVASDVTDRKRWELELADREAQLRRVIDNTLFFIGVLGTDGTLLEANASALKSGALERDDVIGQKFWDCYWWNFDEPSIARLQDAFRRALAGEVVRYDVETRMAGDTRMTIDFMLAPVRDQHNNIAHLIASGVDISDRVQAEQALRASEQKAQLANASKSEFVANMSHEIRTPMTAVLGYADLLLAQENDPEKLEHLRTIQRNGNFLLAIINDILDLSKMEAGKLEISNEWFSVFEVVEDVRSMMHVRATERNLAFEVEYEGQIPERIESDPKRLRQVLINLTGNAVKFTESGRVRLHVRELQRDDRSMIEFRIVDTGIGISAEQQERLFQSFSQGDAAVNRSFGGTGLGLAISKRLVQMLGGEISVESEWGKGSCFSFTIAAGNVADQRRIVPTLNAAPEAALATPVTGAIESHPLTCRVLIVDDRRDVRFLSTRILSQAGAEVEQLEDGLEAIQRMTADPDFMHSIDLVLLDMQMPRMDGYQTATRLREMGFHKPIVALTADAMQSDMNRCIEAGCNDFLSKPIDRKRLIDTVARLTTSD